MSNSETNDDFNTTTFGPLPPQLLVMLNGPPGIGKDELADRMVASKHLSSFIGFTKQEMKESLYAEVAKHYSVSRDCVYELNADRDSKEKPNELFGGLSVRQAMIHVSEDILKPEYGEGIFGSRAAELALYNRSDRVVVSDTGFADEIVELVKPFEKAVIIRLRAAGFDFRGDSRSYVTLGNRAEHVREYDVRVVRGDVLDTLYRIEDIVAEVLDV